MPFVKATDRPVYWSVVDGGVVIAADVTEPGGLTLTGEDKILPNDTDENAYLGKVVGLGGDYNPLPDVGEQVEAGVIYGYNGGLVICRQSHTRTAFPPEETLALFIVYRENATDILTWVAGEQVQVGTHRIYEGVEYACLQAHVTQSDWTPPAVPALWQVYVEVPPTAEWQAGVAYTIGDEVTYQGVLYRCRQSHTSQIGWEPPNVLALWLPI